VIEFRSTKAVPASSQWTSYKTLKIKATPATARVSLPADFANKSWRARVVQAAVPAAPKKFPSKYYTGKRSFKSAVAPSYAVQSNQSTSAGSTSSSAKTVSLSANSVSSPTVASDIAGNSGSAAVPSPTTGTPVESDIWETYGTSVYYFNQLRGLQVIDLSNPSNPLLTATYRLPAVGQDLYVVQGAGSTNYAILLTRQYDQNTYQSSTGILMVAICGGTTQLVSSNNLPGWMADSRMVGNQLYIATQQWNWGDNGNGATTSLNQMTVDPLGGTIFPGTSQTSQGYFPIISAGDDWLAVSQYGSDWQNSHVTLYGLDTNGATLLTPQPIVLNGPISDEYDVQYSGGILSTVTSHWVQNTSDSNSWWSWNPVILLQNFSPDGTLQGSLQIDNQNSYSKARFVGSTLYLLTAWQSNLLYTVDNTIPTAPVIAGQVALPGYTTQIEPIGDQLFSLGYDANWNLTASLFDVSNIASPNLHSSVALSSNANTSWGYSTATYDKNGLNVMADAGLLSIPYSCNNSDGSSASYIQLLSLDGVNRTLALAGTVPTGANPLRSKMVNGALTSITQRELVTADVSNPNAPSVLADLTLAWTVDKIAISGNYLIEVTANSTWDGQVPTATIAPSNDPDNALTQTPLGAGSVLDAQVQGNNLYVLRQNPANTSWSRWGIYPLRAYSDTTTATSSNPSLFLDIYDVSNLPKLTLVGSVASQLPSGESSWDVGKMLFASPTSVAVVAQPTARNFWCWYGPIVYDAPVMMADTATVLTPVAKTGKASPACMIPWYGWGYGSQSTNPANAMTFQISDPTAPVAFVPIPLTEQVSTPVKCATAGSGLLVFGYGDKETPCGSNSAANLSSSLHHLRILDLTDVTTPVLGPAIDLPGRLQAVSALATNGFLAWTESYEGGPQIQVSACDGVSVSQVSSIALTQDGSMTALGQDLFTTQGNSVNRFSLNNSGTLTATGTLPLSWSPTCLSAQPDVTGSNSTSLLGGDWSHLLNSVWTIDGGVPVEEWNVPLSTDVSLDLLQPDQSVLVPQTDYGVGQYLSQ